MQLRGVVSDKYRLIKALEEAYIKATSEKNFYKQLEDRGFTLYYRGSKEYGVVLKRRFRLKKLGFDREVLLGLNKKLSKSKRLKTLATIRKQQQTRNKDRSR